MSDSKKAASETIQLTLDSDKPEPNSNAKEAMSRLVKGGASGLLASIILQPLQVIKTSMQVSPIDKTKIATITNEKIKPNPKGNPVYTTKDVNLIKSGRARHGLTFSQATQLIYQREGLPGFMRGFVPSVMKGTVNSGVYFGMLFYNEQLLTQLGWFSQPNVQFISSAAARIAQTVISNPLIVIKTRFEVVGFNEYKNTIDAAIKIAQNEGLRGFFTGLKVSLLRDVPFSGIFYPIYMYFKSYFYLLMNL